MDKNIPIYYLELVKKMKKNISLSLLSLFFMVIIVSCDRKVMPTIAPMVTIQSEFTETPVIMATITSAPEIDSTPTIEMDNNVTPTVSSGDKDSFVSELIESNGNCDLPCLWGIVPGVTTWESIEPFLTSISDYLKFGDETVLKVNGSEYSLYPHYYSYTISDGTEALDIMIATNPDSFVDVITTEDPLTSSLFQVNQLFSVYGMPEDILVHSTDEYIPGVEQPWYWLVLLYPEKGFAALYQGEGELVDEGIKSCPGSIGPDLLLLSYEELTVETISPLVKRIFFYDEVLPDSIVSVSDLTIDSVYNDLLDQSGCIVFPILAPK